MISGIYTIIYSKDPDADSRFLTEAMGMASPGDGSSGPLFRASRGEVEFFPSDTSTAHEIYFQCDDLERAKRSALEFGVTCGETRAEEWGTYCPITLPGGSAVVVFQSNR